MKRYIIGAVAILSAFVLPWWVTLLVCVYGAFRYPFFFEALIAGLIIDVLYGTHAVWGIYGITTVATVLLLLCMSFIRRNIRYETLSKN